jgi:hypothetical protein
VYVYVVTVRPMRHVKLMWRLSVSLLYSWGTMLQAERPRVQFPMRSLDFSIDLILPAALWSWG